MVKYVCNCSRTKSSVTAKAVARKMKYQICTNCVMDTSDPLITFDEHGVCNHCRAYRDTVSKIPRFRPDAANKLAEIVENCRRQARGRRYDCLIGVSGGVDSTYLAYYVKTVLKLNPLAVHLDNGWNSELAVQNIERMLTKLDIDLHTEVLNWHEFSSLQLAFLRSSTPDSEIPTDHAIFSTLYQMAIKENIPTIFLGINLVTEFILPQRWSYGHRDWVYINGINRRFGSRDLKTFPHTPMWKYFYLFNIKKLNVVRPYDYIDFNKAAVEEFINKELDWQPYATKHYESYYTKFYQGYLLPKKFGFDKRRAHLSTLICAGQTTREQALQTLQEPSMPPVEVSGMLDYVAKKFGISREEMDQICTSPAKTYEDYPHAKTNVWLKAAKRVYRLVSPAGKFKDGLSN